MVAYCSAAVLNHLSRRSTSDMPRFWGHHSFSRSFWSELVSWTGCALVFFSRVKSFKIFVSTRNLKDSLGVDFAFRPVWVTDLDLGTLHVED